MQFLTKIFKNVNPEAFSGPNKISKIELFAEKIIYSAVHYFCKKVLSYNHGHNILELYNVLIQTGLTTSKTKRDI